MSRKRHIPLRRCVVCRTQRPQAELLRMYRDDAGWWQLDPSGKAGGRGAWLCHSQAACVGASVKQLTRFFRGQAERVHGCLQQYDQQPDQQPASTLAPSEPSSTASEVNKEVDNTRLRG